jgi:hypothetical protein
VRIGQVGLGYWGPNLARNFDYLADLRWLCDLDEEHLKDRRKSSSPSPRNATSRSCLAIS